MSAPITRRPSAYDFRRSLTALIAAAALALILHAIAAPVAAATTVRASVTKGTLLVSGTPSADRIALRLSRSHPNRLQVDIGDNGSADRSFTLGSFARIEVEAGGGNDRIRLDTSHGAFTSSRPTRVHGGAGNDTLIGGSGNETFFGGTGNDVVDGNGGTDSVSLGAGNDTAVWDPGDGSDVVRGGGGSDTLVFNGSNADEELAATADATRVRFTRDVGNVAMTLSEIERLDVNALGGNDELTVNDLAGTGLTRVNVDLAVALGGTTADGAADTVAIVGTAGDDTIAATADGCRADRFRPRGDRAHHPRGHR